LVERQVARRVAWLRATAAEIPGLLVDSGAPDRLGLRFASDRQAADYHRALLAESMPARLNGQRIELRVEAWYSPADIQSLALALAKVAHYLAFDE
jgi:hypothetical protein